MKQIKIQFYLSFVSGFSISKRQKKQKLGRIVKYNNKTF